MSPRRAVSIFLFPIVATLARAALPLPLSDGERLTYRVSWAIVPGAGEIKVIARRDDTSPQPRLIVTTNTTTRRMARLLLPFEAEAKSVFDLQTGKLVSLSEVSVTRNKRAEHTLTFDYTASRATYVTASEPDKPRVQNIPPGDPTDLIIGLLQTRNWDVKPGDKRDALVIFDDDFYDLTLYALGYDNLRTPMGTFNTLVLQPRMEKTEPKGMFRRGSTVRVWIAQDAHHLPVKFEVEFKIGTGTAMLESYQPPPNSSEGSAAGAGKP